MRISEAIASVRLHAVTVTPKTVWQFIEIESADGLTGVGEATVMPEKSDLREDTASLARRILGQSADPNSLADPLPSDKLGAAVRSAVDHALWDIATQRSATSLAEGLGSLQRDRIPVYANINRRTVDRRQEGFVATAKAAIADGHTRFKIAPFDELSPDLVGDDLRMALDAGFARVAAVREFVGEDSQLMVDCHWRCTAESAETVIREAGQLGLYWVECPVAETVANVSLLARLRSLANEFGVRLAGCEENIGLDGFRPFIDGGAYDVLMPDVKYTGGLSQFLKIAEASGKNGMDISPHNPSGPISHLLSLDVCSVLPNLLMLEMQYDESPLFDTLVDVEIPSITEGMSASAVFGPGLAAKLVLEAAGRNVLTTEWSG